MTAPASARSSGGDMATRAAALPDKGLLHFIDSTRDDAADIREQVVAPLERRIAAAEEQPLAPAVAELLNQARLLAAAAASALEDAYLTGRKLHEADYDRHEEPRKGSVGVESRADAQTSEADRR